MWSKYIDAAHSRSVKAQLSVIGMVSERRLHSVFDSLNIFKSNGNELRLVLFPWSLVLLVIIRFIVGKAAESEIENVIESEFGDTESAEIRFGADSDWQILMEIAFEWSVRTRSVSGDKW